MPRTITRLLVTAAFLVAGCALGGCASLLPIAGALVLKEAADRYEKSETTAARPARGASSGTVQAGGVQVGEGPTVKAPEGSAAAKVASVPTSAAGAEDSATESTARILATAIKRVPTPTSQPVSSQRPTQD